ncbi:MAG TPA: AIM24 family protein [Streptosporangiaceae bacterium]|jgi:uncharacterized protein (AIM24 family)|nr:AIM24 family protein [Streptosporangiaceae bacterium]
MSTPTATYTCPYCRIPSDGSGTTCPHCGAATDVRARVTKSGWAEQPPIRDMARIRFNRSTCQISGKYVPVAEMKLDPSDSVYFSHHVLLHSEPSVQLDMMKMAGGWNRMLAGMPLIMMTARGPGHVAISADHPGETLAVPLPANHAVDVVEHRFLVATSNVGYQWERAGVWFATQNGNEQEYHYPLGATMDRFTAQGGPGLLLLHAPGNTFIRDLQQGERILIQPGGLIWKDRSVRMFLHFEYPRGNYWFSSARWQAKSIWLVLQGPGRVAVQSVFERPETVGGIVSSSGATTQYW